MEGMEETCSQFPQRNSLVGVLREANGKDPIHE